MGTKMKVNKNWIITENTGSQLNQDLNKIIVQMFETSKKIFHLLSVSLELQLHTGTIVSHAVFVLIIIVILIIIICLQCFDALVGHQEEHSDSNELSVRCWRGCNGMGMCEDTDWVKKCMEYEVEGPRPRGRPKRTWKEVVQKYCQSHNLNREDGMDRGRWKKLIKIG